MIPGEIRPAEGLIEINVGRPIKNSSCFKYR